MADERSLLAPLALLRLQSWLSPALPIGAYTYSHGIEWAVEAGDVHDCKSLIDWLAADLRFGSGRNEAMLFAETWRCARRDDRARLCEVAELAAALRGTAELALESSQQALACLAALRRVWPDDILEWLAETLREREIKPTLPVVLAARAARESIPIHVVLSGYLQSYAANLVIAGVRLIPLGQPKDSWLSQHWSEPSSLRLPKPFRPASHVGRARSESISHPPPMKLNTRGAGAARGTHHRRRDRRLPRQRNSRRCVHESRRRRRDEHPVPACATVFHRVWRRQPCDNLAATFSPELADLTIYVIDVAGGEKIPRKEGPGITRSDLLVINKIDLAPSSGGSRDHGSRRAAHARRTSLSLLEFETRCGCRRDRRLHHRARWFTPARLVPFGASLASHSRAYGQDWWPSLMKDVCERGISP